MCNYKKRLQNTSAVSANNVNGCVETPIKPIIEQLNHQVDIRYENSVYSHLWAKQI